MHPSMHPGADRRPSMHPGGLVPRGSVAGADMSAADMAELRELAANHRKSVVMLPESPDGGGDGEREPGAIPIKARRFSMGGGLPGLPPGMVPGGNISSD